MEWWSVIPGWIGTVLAVAGWIDTRKRLVKTEVRFEIEHESNDIWRVRNVGSRSIFHASIDTDSVARFPLEANLMGRELAPEQSTGFILRRDSYGHLPAELRLKFSLRVGGPTHNRVVRFPDTASSQSAEG